MENASLQVNEVWPRIIVHDIDGCHVCRAGSLRGENEILGELFPRSQASIANLDIVTNPEAAQPNQTRDQIADFDGCAHVQHEELSASCKSTRLDNKTDGLWDRHEIALHIRMRDGYGTTSIYLTNELGKGAATTAYNVAESNAAKDRIALILVSPRQKLPNPLGKAQGIDRIHSLIGGYEDEAFTAVLQGAFANIERTLNIDKNGLVHVLLQDRHMLVRSSVKYYGRTVPSENLLDLGLRCHAG